MGLKRFFSGLHEKLFESKNTKNNITTDYPSTKTTSIMQTVNYSRKLICKQCNTELPDGSAFCNKCGTKVELTPLHQGPPIYIDALCSIKQEHIGKYVQIMGLYTRTQKCNNSFIHTIVQPSLSNSVYVDIETTEPLPTYIVNVNGIDRFPFIFRGILDVIPELSSKYILRDAIYQGYWRDKRGVVRCLKDSCQHECSKDCPIHLHKIGKKKYAEGKPNEALALFKHTVFLSPDFADAWCSLGYLYLDFKKHYDAYESFFEADKYTPNNERIMYGEIVSLSNVGRLKEASILLERYQELFPSQSPESLSNLIDEKLSKIQKKPRITDEEYMALAFEKGFTEFWKNLIEEKERTFAFQACEYTGNRYRKRCKHLECIVKSCINGDSKRILQFRQALIKENVDDANSMIMFDVIKEYENRFIRY